MTIYSYVNIIYIYIYTVLHVLFVTRHFCLQICKEFLQIKCGKQRFLPAALESKEWLIFWTSRVTWQTVIEGIVIKICYIDILWYSLYVAVVGSDSKKSRILHSITNVVTDLFQGVTATTNKPTSTVSSSFPTWKLGTHFERSKLAEPVQLPVAAEVRGVDTSRKSSSLGKVQTT